MYDDTTTAPAGRPAGPCTGTAREQALDVDVEPAGDGPLDEVQDFEFGRKYTVPGDLKGPAGSVPVLTVWIQEPGPGEYDVQLVRRQMTFHRPPPRRPGANLKPVSEVVSDRVWRAMLDASALLDQLGVKHALIGALAVGAHGWPRATKDVDFLVDDTAWTKTEAGLVVMRAGLPVQAHGVPIDTISVRDDERHLFDAIAAAEVTEGVPVAPIEAVVYTKLASPRSKDRQDVIELVRGGADVEKLRRYIEAHASHLVTKLDDVVKTVGAEEE